MQFTLRVRKRRVRGQTYYYLEHSFRLHGKVVKKELYLGSSVPENIRPLEESLFAQIYKEKWYPVLDAIAARYTQEMRQVPKSSKEKEFATFAMHFTYDTQKIEGSTLTLRETADLLERGLSPRGRPMDDVEEAEAHLQLFYDVLKAKSLSLNEILGWHKKLFSQTKPDIAGSIRKTGVRISGSRFSPPLPVEIYPLLREFFSWYSRNKGREQPVVLAALVHLKFVTIHPFADGNGRISRLMMNFVLHKRGFPLISIPYEDRSSYYRALERSQLSNGADPFVSWFIKRYVKEHRPYSKLQNFLM